MPGIGTINLKVVVVDSDFYALQALNSYLAWDRRTRVTFLADGIQPFWDYLDELSPFEMPDVIVLDADHLGGSAELTKALQSIHQRIRDAIVVCLAQAPDATLAETAAEHGARAFLLKQDVRLQIAWAIVYSLDQPFVITSGIARATRDTTHTGLYRANILPEQRDYPEMTERIRQAIKLCVIEGMPAHLAADEMGISLHTIRGYVKEGYRILETYDQTEYPLDMTPQERAFMRFTALADDETF